MLVGAGLRQTIDWSGTGVETFNTNMAAMVDAVQESYPSTWTPLSEALYETIGTLHKSSPTYCHRVMSIPLPLPVAVRTASGLAKVAMDRSARKKSPSWGSGESCSAGYIANACGRDPYFFGKDHTPAWSSTSQVVSCCRTFVIVFTDGESTQDQNIPVGLQDYAHAHHGGHCIGTDNLAPPRPVDLVCNTHQTTPYSDLLAEHKTDYVDLGSHFLDDVAYWGHTNDLRPCNGTADGTIPVLGITGHCIPGNQNVTVYSFYAFGAINARGLLAQTARLGGFEDANGDGVPQTNEWDRETT